MFTDCREAGAKLMPLVKQYTDVIDLVLALPQGGEEVAAAIATELGKPMNLLTDPGDIDVANQGVLLVHEGASNSASLASGVRALRHAGAQPVGVAVPVASIPVISVMEDRAPWRHHRSWKTSAGTIAADNAKNPNLVGIFRFLALPAAPPPSGK